MGTAENMATGWEGVPAVPHVATFSDAAASLILETGAGGKGSVLVGWTHPIRLHDAAVVQLEEAMLLESRLHSAFKVKDRTFRNWEVAWDFLCPDPLKLEEFLDLKHQMRTFKARFHRADNEEERFELAKQWERFCELEPQFSKVLAAQVKVEEARQEREEARGAVLEHARLLLGLRAAETKAAARITDDHARAIHDEQTLWNLFPAVRSGYLLTRLISSGGRGTEAMALADMPPAAVMAVLQEAPRPHTLEFRRYDYRRDSSGRWRSLAELLRVGRYVPDPDRELAAFHEACRSGDEAAVAAMMDVGEDPCAPDRQGCCGVHHAAAHGRDGVLRVLLKRRPDGLEARDHNMQTPLLLAVRCGGAAVAAAAELLVRGARLDAVDAHLRTPLMHAVRCGDPATLALVLAQQPDVRAVESGTGWTALHVAAQVGNAAAAAALLARRASAYAVSAAGLTPLDVAVRGGQRECAELLARHMAAEPAVRFEHGDSAGGGGGGGNGGSNGASNSSNDSRSDGGSSGGGGRRSCCEIWIGTAPAAYPSWAMDRGFDAVLTVADTGPGTMPPRLAWLADADDVRHLCIEVASPVLHDDPSETAWAPVALQLRVVLDFIDGAERDRRRLLVHCLAGRGAAVGIVAAHRLLRHGVHVEHTLQRAREAQPKPAAAVFADSLPGGGGDGGAAVTSVSAAVTAGLMALQMRFEIAKQQRLSERLRNAPILSIGF